jgi:hypothetical protein
MGEKLTIVVGVCLIVLTFSALIFFVSISTVSVLTWHISRYWNACFLLCSFALGGWMILYSAQLRFGGGVFIHRNNLLLLWFLIFAVLISALARFGSPQRYIAVLVFFGLSLAAFHAAVPGLTSPSMLIRLLKNERSAQSTVGPHS